MIGGIYESPLAMRAFLKWRDEVDDGTMLLRDIIDLETTYSRINGGANEPALASTNINNFKLTDLNSSNISKELDLKKNDIVVMPAINFVSSYNILKLFCNQ